MFKGVNENQQKKEILNLLINDLTKCKNDYPNINTWIESLKHLLIDAIITEMDV